MPMRFKVNILQELKARGYSSYRIRQEKLFAESTVQKLRQGLPVSWENLETICALLDCQPGDVLEYVKMNADEDG